MGLRRRADHSRRAALVIVVAGAGVRIALAAQLWRTPLDPDAREYVRLAKGFSYLRPWAASPREPLWVGLVKSATAPFGYSAHSLRVLGVVLAVAGLAAAWTFLSHVASRRVALVALGILALDPQLVYDAVRGLREPLTLLLMIPLLATLIGGDDDAQLARLRRLVPSTLVALLLVRWELGMLALVLALAAVIARRLRARRFVLAVVVGGALVAPWLVANGHRYGDALYHSNRAAVFARNLDVVYGGKPGPRPTTPYSGPPITWTDYYLHFLGPREAAVREVSGTVANLHRLLEGYPEPPWPGWPATGAVGRATAVGRAVVLSVAASLALVALVGTRPPQRRRVWICSMIVLVDAAAYGVASRRVDYRGLTWAAPAVAFVVATGVDVIVRRLRNERPPMTSGL